MIKLPLAVSAFGFTWALFVYVATAYDDPVLSSLLNTALFGLAFTTLLWAGFEMGDLLGALRESNRRRVQQREESLE